MGAFSFSVQTIAAPPKSLYERIGGIHKIAAAVDVSVDMEWNDPILNANPRFKMAEAAGKPFAKFAITNTLAVCAGGPQKLAFNAAAVTKWIGFTKEQFDRAWSIHETACEKVGMSKKDFMEFKAMYLKMEAMAKPMQPTPETFASTDSLYARLGGIVPISTVVDEFVNMLATDPTIGSNPQVVRSLTSGNVTGPGLKYLVTEQLVQAAGGPCTYSGRTMKDAHHGLMISEKEWQVGAQILKKVLDKYQVPAKEQGEIFQAIASSHDDIVGH
ncbi:MAG TPA: group 1 truncated hemoglobin [Fimbriimonadaceae bacterium]|nr:group 1 truncated hemoglobin [Fimbriimonadaceae bacterium]